MKTSEPKMILNLSLEDEELQKKVAIAMDDYVEKIVIANLDIQLKRLLKIVLTNWSTQIDGVRMVKSQVYHYTNM